MATFLSRLAWAARLLYPVVSLAYVLHATEYGVSCNGHLYGNPISAECISTLASFPIHDTAVHYFVEQQLRTAPPAAVWDGFKDPRPPSEGQTIVQLPKWTSYGRCNVALFSFTKFKSSDGKLSNSASELAWSDIFTAGLKLDSECFANNQGGAIVVADVHGQPGLSLFMWEDGAPFEFLLNQEETLEFPLGMDPTNPSVGPSLFNNGTLKTGLRATHGSLTQGVSALYL